MEFTNTVFMVRPANFRFNEQTSASNAFQIKGGDFTSIREKALSEFDAMQQKLSDSGINVFVIEDTADPAKPDAIFPNNWISLHKNGTVVLYPMEAENRRLERREDIMKTLEERFDVNERLNLSYNEQLGRYLEGTGSIVFGHREKTAYAAISSRTHPETFKDLCGAIGYRPVLFHAFDEHKKPIYHTNVMMCIGNGFAVICLDTIPDAGEKEYLRRILTAAGRTIIEISPNQVKRFAGNMLQLQNREGKKILVLSQTAYDAFTEKQRTDIRKYTEMLPIGIPTIEQVGGGSVRCMIAENFLTPKKNGFE